MGRAEGKKLQIEMKLWTCSECGLPWLAPKNKFSKKAAPEDIVCEAHWEGL